LRQGDNFPRGVNLHRFPIDGVWSGKPSRVVYNFKTRHGDKPTSPAGKSYPYYGDISGGGKNFYKWSNDNDVYVFTTCTGAAPKSGCCRGAR